MERYAFGIDLAGYTTGRSVVAVMLQKADLRQFWLLRDSPFSKIYRTDALLSEIVSAECDALRAMSRLGPIAVDVPIDLQTVERPEKATRVWQLYKRPIDQAFNAMPALADRIGAPYARMRAILAHSEGSLLLGRDVFETYPKALLQTLRLPWRGYKGTKPAHDQARKLLCGALRWCEVATDDDLDAILCAIAAGASNGQRYADDALKSLIASKLPRCENCHPPRGFILLRELPPAIGAIEEADFCNWIRERQ